MTVTRKDVFNKIMLFAVCMCVTIAVTYNKNVEVVNFADLLQAHKRCLGIGPAAILLGTLVLINNKRELIRKDTSRWIPCASLLLSQCYWAGYKLDYSMEIFRFTFWSMAQWLVVSIGIFCIVYLFINYIFDIIDEDKCFASEVDLKERKRWTRITFLLCVLIWSVFFILFYPGVVTNDSYWQINQALGFELLSNHHPFMHTLMESLFLRPAYNVLKNTEIGIAAFMIFQMLVMSAIIAYAQAVLCDLKVGKAARTAVLLFYVANPLFGIYSVTMWKDIWMGMMLLLYLALLAKLFYLHDNSRITKVMICLSGLGVLFSKATGIAMVGLSLIATLWLLYKRKEKKSGALIPIALSLGIFLITQSLAINVMGVIPSESRESKSILLQQIARTVKINGDRLSDEEREEINLFLPYDDLAENYNPRLSDPVKNTFKEESFNENKMLFFKLWIKLGMKYPTTYIKSFLYNTYGYWYPDTDYWVAANQGYGIFLINKQNNVYDQYIDKYHISDEYFENRVNIVNRIFSVRRLPGLSLFFSIGAYFWAYVIIAIWSIIKKRLLMAIPLSLALAVFISCLMSPLYCEMRYGYPAVIIIPIAIILAMIDEERIRT